MRHLSAHRGNLVLVGDGGDHGHRGGDGVVRGGVDRIDLPHHRLDHLLHLIGAGGGVFDALDTQAVELFGRKIDLQLGIGLGRAVEQADRLRLGNELVQQFDLVGDGIHVGSTGDVAARGVVVLNQPRGGEVGDGSADDRNVGGCTRDRLGGRRGDSEDQVAILIHERARDGLAGRLVVLSILLIDRGIDARRLDRGDKALVGGVEGGVLGELQDADLVRCTGGRSRTGIGGTIATAADKAEAACSGERSRADGALRERATGTGHVIHGYSPCAPPEGAKIVRRATGLPGASRGRGTLRNRHAGALAPRTQSCRKADITRI